MTHPNMTPPARKPHYELTSLFIRRPEDFLIVCGGYLRVYDDALRANLESKGYDFSRPIYEQDVQTCLNILDTEDPVETSDILDTIVQDAFDFTAKVAKDLESFIQKVISDIKKIP